MARKCFLEDLLDSDIVFDKLNKSALIEALKGNSMRHVTDAMNAVISSVILILSGVKWTCSNRHMAGNTRFKKGKAHGDQL